MTTLSIFALQQRLAQELEVHDENPKMLKVHVYSNGKSDAEAEKAALIMGVS